MSGSIPRKRWNVPGIGRILLALSSLALASSSTAQSPTAMFLRIAKAETRSAAVVEREPVVVTPLRRSRPRDGKTVVLRVKAATPRAARRAAVRYVYVQKVRTVGLPLRELQAFRSNLAAMAADLKMTKATVLEANQPKGQFTVSVDVASDDLGNMGDLRGLRLFNYRLVALLPETIDGKRVASPAVETALVGALARQRFQVYDGNFVATQKPLARLVAATLADHAGASAQLGTRFWANTLVLGRVDAQVSQSNGGIISYIATANLRVLRADTGRVLVAREFREKGFGQDSAQAARNALAALAALVSRELPDELLATFEHYPVNIQMASSSPEEANQVEDYLRGLTGVVTVEKTQRPSGVVFHITNRDKPAALGAQIAAGGRYSVLEYGLTEK